MAGFLFAAFDPYNRRSRRCGSEREQVERGLNDALERGSGPSDRASDGVQAIAGGGGEDALRSGEGDSGRGVERAAGEVPGDGVR